MQITSRQIQPGARGYALTITIIMLAVVLVIFASIFYWASGNATITIRNNQYNMSENAAESAVETVVGRIDRDFIYQSISNASAYTGLPATINQSTWPVQYTFSDTNGNPNVAGVVISGSATNTVALNSEYSGLYGLAQSVDVYATATPTGQPQTVPAIVHESLQFANIPLYQFAIFYNVNMEICPGQPMAITGPVFCNQSIWEGSSQASFSSTVTAVGTNDSLASDPFATSYAPQSVPATFSLAGEPVNHANSLVMPIGTNNNPSTILSLLQLPPTIYAMGTSAAYSSNGIVYPANGADLVITNFATGTNFGTYGTNLIVYFQDGGLTQVPYDYYLLRVGGTTNYIVETNSAGIGAASNVVYAGFSWVTNVTFGDWREGYNGGSGPAKHVQAVQIDVNMLNKWLTNTIVPHGASSGYTLDESTKLLHSGHHIDSVYVYNSVPETTTVLPAVRVINGRQMPTPGNSYGGFTVATPFPMYVYGDYNSQSDTGSALGQYGTNGATANTYPAALMADSITILSDSWGDGTTTINPTAGSTTVNAAMLEGIVQSNPAISGNYSGGVENFMRLLENWGSKTLTYNGSIVVLFYSQYATNSWNGGYYGVPTRHWAFDLNFEKSSGLPPLTPQIKAMIRGQWYAHQ
jgi:hypothetical protein